MAAEAGPLVQRLIFHLHDMGRMVTLNEIESHVDPHSLRALRKHFGMGLSKRGALKKLVYSLPRTFYVTDEGSVQSGNHIYVSLSRRYATYTLRAAHALQDVYEKGEEVLLLGEKGNWEENPACVKYEYLIGKTTLSIMEILAVLECCVRNHRDSRASLRRTVQLAQEMMSPLGKAFLMYCSPDGDLLSGLRTFLSLFPRPFTVTGRAVRISWCYFDRLWLISEMDLLWSYVGIRLYKGAPTISTITRDVGNFADVIGFRNAWDINESFVRSLVAWWFPQFFVARDGTIYPASYPSGVHEDHLSKIEKFFTDYLEGGKGHVHWKHSFQLLKKHRPHLVERWPSATSEGIATYLRTYGVGFDIVDDGLVASPQDAEHIEGITVDECFRMEIPLRSFEPGSKPLSPDGRKAFGVVSEVALLSAVVLFPGCSFEDENQGGDSSSCLAFCHVDSTTLKKNQVDDLAAHFSAGDCLEFVYEVVETPYILRPCYANVVDIIEVHPFQDEEEETLPGEEEEKEEEEEEEEILCPVHHCKVPEKVYWVRDVATETDGPGLAYDLAASEPKRQSPPEGTRLKPVRPICGARWRQQLYLERFHCSQCRGSGNGTEHTETCRGRTFPAASGRSPASHGAVNAKLTPESRKRQVRESGSFVVSGKFLSDFPTETIGALSPGEGSARKPQGNDKVSEDQPKTYRELVGIDSGSADRRHELVMSSPPLLPVPQDTTGATTSFDRYFVLESSQRMMRILGWMKVLSDFGVPSDPTPRGESESRDSIESLVRDAVLEASSAIELADDLGNLLNVLQAGPMAVVELVKPDEDELSGPTDRCEGE